MPRLSIIIPTFNSAKTLSRCLDSVISQSFTDWEVLMMDGVSNDDTIKIASSYQDSRIRIYSEPDKGIYDAMNKGIDKAQGEWLYFLGSDDWLFNCNSLKDIFCNNINQYDVVYGTVYAPHLHPQTKGEWTLDNYMYNRCHQSIFYKKSFFGNSIRYNIKYKAMADNEINLRWFLQPQYSKCYYPVVVASFSDGGYSSMYCDYEFNHDQIGLILKYGRHFLPIEEKKKMAWWYMSMHPEKKVQISILRFYVFMLRIRAKLAKIVKIT